MAAFQLPDSRTPVLETTAPVFNLPWYLLLQNLFSTIGNGQVGTATQVLHGGGAGYLPVSLVSDVTGILPLVNGGTNVSTAPTVAQVLIAQSGSATAWKSLSGDVTNVSSGAVTIGTNVVTNAKLAQMAANSLKGNNTGAPANAVDLTVAQVLTMLGTPSQTIAAWTPTDGSGAALSFTNVSANYTQIGNIVHAYFTLTYPATIDGSAAIIAGLPVTVANANYAEVPSIVTATVTITGGLVLKALKSTTTAKFDVGSPFGVVTNAQLSGGTLTTMLIYPAT